MMIATSSKLTSLSIKAGSRPRGQRANRKCQRTMPSAATNSVQIRVHIESQMPKALTKTNIGIICQYRKEERGKESETKWE